jgi:transposase
MAVGRNNWSFSAATGLGKTMAILRSFVASCELLKLDPFEWFRDVLSRILIRSIQHLDQLLPRAWVAARV